MSLREAMDRLFEQSVLRPRQTGGAGQAAQQAWRIPLDVYETPHELVIRGWAPGVKADDLAITADQGTLSIRGRIAPPATGDQQVVWHARELFSGDIYATVALPPTVDVDRAEAGSEAGVLTLRIPKAEAARPKRIRVQSQA
jgi:HSP20 family protein